MSEHQETLLPTTLPSPPSPAESLPSRVVSLLTRLHITLLLLLLALILILLFALTCVTTYILFPVCVAVALRRLRNHYLICTRWDRIFSIGLIIFSFLEVVVVAADAWNLFTGKRAWDNESDGTGKRFYRGWLFVRDSSVGIVYILEGLAWGAYIRRVDGLVRTLDGEKWDSVSDREMVKGGGEKVLLEEKNAGRNKEGRDLEKAEGAMQQETMPT